jgi:uncharacterized metal-binding protein YceD (DUF177 family)
MKIYIRDIPQDSTLHIEQDLDAGFLDLQETGTEAVGPIHCSLDVGISDNGLYAIGSLSLPVRMTCVACLEPFESELVVPDFGLQIPLAGSETMDLTPHLREDILLVLPSHPRCDADGLRQCPANFPSAPGGPLSEEVIPDSSAWNALDQLKTKQ